MAEPDLGIEGLSRFTPVGAGGFSTVYAAVDDGFDRWVAVKVLHSIDDDGRRRFERERGLMGRLGDHPNVVTPYRFGYTTSGSPYLVMEYLRGGSLQDLLERQGPLPWDQAVSYILPVADAVGRAHAEGFLHRDIKPANILLNTDGQPKLTDFGIAFLRGSTSTQVAFTLGHTPPETFVSGTDDRDARSDLYSLGSTLFTLVTGAPPYELPGDDSQPAYLRRIETYPVPRLEGDPRHDAFIGRVLAKNPDERPPDAAHFAAELRATLGPTPAAATVAVPPSATIVAPPSTDPGSPGGAGVADGDDPTAANPLTRHPAGAATVAAGDALGGTPTTGATGSGAGPETGSGSSGRTRLLVAMGAVVAALAVAGGAIVALTGGDDSAAGEPQAAATTTSASTSTTPTTEPVDEEPAEIPAAELPQLPGAGTTVTMARANWVNGYFQAAVYQQLLGELGYEVSDPSLQELPPSELYRTSAEGDVDLSVNGWYPSHLVWHEQTLSDGTRVGDRLEILGLQIPAGGVQGMVITRSWAERFGVRTLDDLNDNPAALAAFDAADPVPGDGVAQIYGCPVQWTCDDIIASQIAFSGWENIEQVTNAYESMLDEAEIKANAGDPMVIYTWGPSPWLPRIRPGDNVVWLGVEEVLDNSNPLGLDGGASLDQRPGTGNLPTDLCPASNDDGRCQVGWVVSDIQVTARVDFLDANPAARALFEVVQFEAVEVSQAVLSIENRGSGEDVVSAIAGDWIAANRDRVDDWLTTARQAAAEADPGA